MRQKNAELLRRFLERSDIQMDKLGLNNVSYYRFESEGYIPLSLDILYRANNVVRLALAHNVSHESGDLMADPDMEFVLDLNGTFELRAQTYQNDFAGVFTSATSPIAERSMDEFATMWLNNLLAQGHICKKAE